MRLTSTLAMMRRRLRNWAKEKVKEKDGIDEVGVVVTTRMLEKKVNHFKGLCCMISVLLAPFTANIIRNIIAGRVRGYTPMQDCVHIFMQLLTSLTMVMPSFMTTKSLDIFYVLLMTASLFYTNPYSCQTMQVVPTLIGTNGMVLALTIAGGPVTGRIMLLFAFNIAFALCSGTTLIVQGTTLSVQGPFLALTQVLTIFLATCYAYSIEQGYRVLIEQSLRFEEAKELELAAGALLRSCCEVVVEIDHSARILSPAADLGSFLLRGPSHCMQGVRLTDLLVDEEDKVQLLERLETPKLRAMGLAENMQVFMKDGDDRRLRLELMWFGFRRLDGQQRYMVGLREYADVVCQRPSAERTTWDLMDSSPHHFDSGGDSFAVPENCSVTSGSLEGVEASFVVDTQSNGFNICSLSSEFCVRIGRLPLDEPILKYVANPTALTTYIQLCYNAVANQQPPPKDLKVTFLMPQGRMRAMCRLAPEHNGERFDSEDMDMLRFLVSSIKNAKDELPSRSLLAGAASLKGTPVAKNAVVSI